MSTFKATSDMTRKQKPIVNESDGETSDRNTADKAFEVRVALREVKDPEIPTLSLEDLGMVYDIIVDHQTVHVQLLPTFVGCPAQEFIRNQVLKRLDEIDGVNHADVTFVMDVPWTSERITETGRAKLEEFGIAPPPARFAPDYKPQCPYCEAHNSDVVSLFGPTACRAVYYCKNCKQPFEGMKFV
ncbi:1,2-phenylacetyl-CoA epoxidase subunit PaaD [Alicyclobacillus sp. SO9]|uniref:1,2-phenylacetyl-CoA epoxidase subunit PaaD n=1 Tax=Alicyclobacillus sp. SO9 TaxID=2665646 RepID=UPI00351C191F